MLLGALNYYFKVLRWDVLLAALVHLGQPADADQRRSLRLRHCARALRACH